jgi:hypothetical protein
MWKTEFS